MLQIRKINNKYTQNKTILIIIKHKLIIMLKNNPESTPICHHIINPEKWDGKTHTWDKKKFVKIIVPHLFNMRIPSLHRKIINSTMHKIEEAKASPIEEEYIWLVHNTKKCFSEHYIHVTKNVAGLNNVEISGKFLTIVFDGPRSKIPKWIPEIQQHVVDERKKLKEIFFYYPPRKKRRKNCEHNYIVAFAEVE